MPHLPQRLLNKTLHVVVDMQRLFAEQTVWHVPGLHTILPSIARLAEALSEHTVFARFTVPKTANAAPGQWQQYYRRWSTMTGEHLPDGMVDLIDPLASLARTSRVFDKPGYSVFGASGFVEHLETRSIDTLVFTGVETDVCILSSVFDAVDRGYRVVLPADGVASSSAKAHDAVLGLVLSRLDDQVEVTSVTTVLKTWDGAGPTT